MAADLKDLHAQPATVPISAQLYSRLSKTIVLLYAVTLLVTAVGVTYALYQNWVVRIEAAKTDLSRSASMGNFLVETALISAANTLDEAQALFDARRELLALSQTGGSSASSSKPKTRQRKATPATEPKEEVKERE